MSDFIEVLAVSLKDIVDQIDEPHVEILVFTFRQVAL
jgi:hypothetical protein